MNKITTKTTSIIKNLRHSIKNDKFGDIICYETYENDKLTDQYFKLKKPNHNGYNPHNMRFVFYGQKINSQQISLDYYNGNYDNFPKQIFIENLNKFNQFNQLYCLNLGSDGCCYVLTNLNPLPSIQLMELWGKDFDLNKCKEHLQKYKNVSDIKIKSNIYQNYSITGTHSLYFYYYATAAMTKKMKTSKYSTLEKNIIINNLKLNKFKYKKKNSNCNVDDDYDYDYDDDDDYEGSFYSD